jgi:hypothetical protein
MTLGGAFNASTAPGFVGKKGYLSEWTRALLGTRSRLLTVLAVLVLLVVVVPIVLLVLGLVLPAAVSVLVGLLGAAAVVMSLLPGQRRWR